MRNAFYLLLLFVLSSCGPKEYSGVYSALNEFNQYVFMDTATFRPQYQNDSLKSSISLAGDYSANDTCNIISKKEFKHYRKLLALHHIAIKPEDFVFKSFAQDPDIQITLFCIPFDGVENDTVILDSMNLAVIGTKRAENKFLVTIFNKRKYWNLLKVEALSCIATLKTGKDYKKIIPIDPFIEVENVLYDSCGGYLLARKLIKRMEYSHQDPMQGSKWIQAALTCNSFIRNNEENERLHKLLYKPDKKKPVYDCYDENAMDYLKSQMIDKKAVMMNELHWQPNHRYLGNLLLEYLYRIGFRYIALEAVWENQDSLNIRKFPIQESGYYTLEPTMSNLIRNALQMGFKVISYDYWDGNDRERSQADNIYKKTFAQDPNAKVFVWGGIEHVNKSPEVHRMGVYLDSLLGGRTLSIEQTISVRNADLISPHYLALNKVNQDLHSGYDIILCNNLKEKDLKVIPTARDITYKYSLTKALQRKVEQHKALLMMVYNKKEFDTYGCKALPIRNVLITNKSPIKVNLPADKYWIIIKSPVETILKKEEIYVN